MIFRFLILLLCLASLSGLSSGRTFDRVIIDPGHGGRDKGAVWGGIQESALNLQIALKVEKLLKKKGVPVTLTRRKDTSLSLRSRAKISQRKERCVFVSIHHNACRYPGVRGVESYYVGTRGKVLAFEIHRRLIAKAKLKDRGIRRRQYLVLRETKCPAVLIECGYLSNSSERKRAAQSGHQQKIAQAIVDGLVRVRR